MLLKLMGPEPNYDHDKRYVTYRMCQTVDSSVYKEFRPRVLRWGEEDSSHIDDNLNVKDPFKWDELYRNNQHCEIRY